MHNPNPNPNTTIAYRIAPINPAFVQAVRSTGRDGQGQAVERHTASGGEPCRDTLRRASPGEPLILASYCPFVQAGPYKEFGPVYVLAGPAPQNEWPRSLADLCEQGYLGDQFVLRAYSAAERIVDGQVVARGGAEEVLQTMLRRPDVQCVLVRFAGYGCYACRIERA